jgi:hypothetical protein
VYDQWPVKGLPGKKQYPEGYLERAEAMASLDRLEAKL